MNPNGLHDLPAVPQSFSNDGRRPYADWFAGFDAASVLGGPEIPPIVPDSRPCLVCGYDLKGLASSGVCPECSSPVLRSLQGNLLRFTSLPYLKSLKQGCLIIELSFAASIILGGLGIAMAIASTALLASRAGAIASAGAEALAAMIGLLGWWIFTSPDPGLLGEDAGSKARKVLRIALIAAAIVALGKFALVFIPGFGRALQTATTSSIPGTVVPGGTTSSRGSIQFGQVTIPIGGGGGGSWWPVAIMGAVGLLALALTITKFYASMFYLRSVVRRIPDPEIEKHVTRFFWLCPLLYTVGMLLCGLGPLIAFIINWVIVDKVRQQLNAIADQHVDAVPVSAA